MAVLMDPLEDPDDILRANRSREKQYIFDITFDGLNSQVGYIYLHNKIIFKNQINMLIVSKKKTNKIINDYNNLMNCSLEMYRYANVYHMYGLEIKVLFIIQLRLRTSVNCQKRMF